MMLSTFLRIEGENFKLLGSRYLVKSLLLTQTAREGMGSWAIPAKR
jgi:hypothetical protein